MSCPDCGRAVSTEAPACPGCGRPRSSSRIADDNLAAELRDESQDENDAGPKAVSPPAGVSLVAVFSIIAVLLVAYLAYRSSQPTPGQRLLKGLSNLAQQAQQETERLRASAQAAQEAARHSPEALRQQREDDFRGAMLAGDTDRLRAILVSGAGIIDTMRDVIRGAMEGNSSSAGLRYVVSHPHFDPNVRSYDQTTPLMWAVGNDDAAMVRLLLARGADPHLTDRDGKSAISRAAGSVDAGIVLLASIRPDSAALAALARTLIGRWQASWPAAGGGMVHVYFSLAFAFDAAHQLIATMDAGGPNYWRAHATFQVRVVNPTAALLAMDNWSYIEKPANPQSVMGEFQPMSLTLSVQAGDELEGVIHRVYLPRPEVMEDLPWHATREVGRPE